MGFMATSRRKYKRRAHKRSWREIFIFLAGLATWAFVVDLLLYFNKLSIPAVFGFIITPESSLIRATAEAVLIVIFYYFGFVKKEKTRTSR
jgi:hypothetical protein